MFVHAQAPCRIGIAGGGTDLPAWTRERAGRCLSLAINVHAHVVAITRADRQVVASYRSRDTAACATEIANGLIRESALMHGWEEGFEIHTMSEISSQGSGLGVSSAFAVALAATFTQMSLMKGDNKGVKIPQHALAASAWKVEINHLHRPIGRQDHMAAAYGGLRLYRFEGDRAEVEMKFLATDAVWIAERLYLVQLPEGHDSRVILAGATDPDTLRAAYDAVDVALRAIADQDAALLGEALRLGHRSKQAIPGAVPDSVSDMVAAAQAIPGVYGCKVAGAGGGGHLVLVAELGSKGVIARTLRLPVRTVVPDLTGAWSEGQA